MLKTISQKMVLSSLIKNAFMWVIFITLMLKDKENIRIEIMDIYTKETGPKAFLTVEEFKNMKMENNLKVILCMEESLGRENIFLMMVESMRGVFIII